MESEERVGAKQFCLFRMTSQRVVSGYRWAKRDFDETPKWNLYGTRNIKHLTLSHVIHFGFLRIPNGPPQNPDQEVSCNLYLYYKHNIFTGKCLDIIDGNKVLYGCSGLGLVVLISLSRGSEQRYFVDASRTNNQNSGARGERTKREKFVVGVRSLVGFYIL